MVPSAFRKRPFRIFFLFRPWSDPYKEGLHHLFPLIVSEKNIGNIFRFHLQIADFLGIDDDHRASFAKPRAAGSLGVHLGGQPCLFKVVLKSLNDFIGTRSNAAGTSTDGNPRFVRVSFLKDVVSEGLQCSAEFNLDIILHYPLVINRIRCLDRRHFPMNFPSISITGPRAQQPRQLTVSRLNFRSKSVSPGLMPVRSCTVSEPGWRRAHGRPSPGKCESRDGPWGPG